MRICIISDLHANLEALEALPGDYDELWVLGDLVNYGPDPAAVIEFVRARASLVIRGNHDHSVGFDEDPRCSPRFRLMAAATRDFTASIVSAADKQYLRELPTSAHRELHGTRFFLCHATPSDLLYEYRAADSPLWERAEGNSSNAAMILTGHTHLQFSRRAGEQVIVNPGSLGQTKAGDPRARYAIWHDGRLELKALDYQVEKTVAKIRSMPVSDLVKSELIHVLRTGQVPSAEQVHND
jgi:protein phosphatase